MISTGWECQSSLPAFCKNIAAIKNSMEGGTLMLDDLQPIDSKEASANVQQKPKILKHIVPLISVKVVFTDMLRLRISRFFFSHMHLTMRK